MSPFSFLIDIAALLSNDTVAAPPEAALKAAAEYTKAHGGQTMLIAFNGKTVFEQYDNGGAVDQALGIASGCKSFVGVAAIAAAQDGFIQLDRPARARHRIPLMV